MSLKQFGKKYSFSSKRLIGQILETAADGRVADFCAYSCL